MENSVSSFGRNISPMKAGLKYGAFLGLALSIFELIAHYTGLQNYSSVEMSSAFLVTAIQWIILALLFFLGIKYFKDNNEGHLTLGEGMTTSMFIGLVSGIISAIFTFIFLSYIAPEALATMSDTIMDSTAVNADFSDLSEEDRQEAEKMMGGVMGFFTSPGFIAATTIFGRIMSAIIFGLVCSLILKTD